MTLQLLQQRAHDIKRQASREYIRQHLVQNAEHHLKRAYVHERVTMRAGEVRRETDAEIREAIRGQK